MVSIEANRNMVDVVDRQSVEETGSGLLPYPFRSQIDKYSGALIKFALIEYYLKDAQLPLITRRVQCNNLSLIAITGAG